MSRKKVVILVAGALVTLGAIAAVSAQGHRGGRLGGHDLGMDDGAGGGMMGRGGLMQRLRGSISSDEYDTQTRERFARFDKNSDGVIDAAEIEAALSQNMDRRRGMMRGRAGGQGPGERMIAAFDENKDGKVTKDEFQNVIKKRFAEADLNNDGKISDEDLPPMMRGRNALSGGAGRGAGMGLGISGGIGDGPGGGMMGFLRDADANKDGVITLDEALAAAMKRFDTFDRNKDGVIDKADFDLMRKEMVDYRVKRFIHQFGADKDGKVTREQFNAKARERFARMDRNGDGKISADEMPGRGMMGLGRGGHHDRRPGMEGPMGRPGRGPDNPVTPKN